MNRLATKSTRTILRTLENHIVSIVPSMLKRLGTATVPITVTDYVAYLRKKIVKREPTWERFLYSAPCEKFIREVLWKRHGLQ